MDPMYAIGEEVEVLVEDLMIDEWVPAIVVDNQAKYVLWTLDDEEMALIVELGDAKTQIRKSARASGEPTENREFCEAHGEWHTKGTHPCTPE